MDRQRQRKKIKTQTDRHRQKDTNRQIIVNFRVLQPQTVCKNLDCLQVWFERIELIWSPGGEASRWKVSYQQGLPRLVFFLLVRISVNYNKLGGLYPLFFLKIMFLYIFIIDYTALQITVVSTLTLFISLLLASPHPLTGLTSPVTLNVSLRLRKSTFSSKIKYFNLFIIFYKLTFVV